MLTREPVEATPRKSFTKKQRAIAFMEAKGRCQVCGEKLSGAYEIDHCVSLFLGGKHEPSNWRVTHPECHREITRKQAGVHAKVKRMKAKAEGTFVKRGPKLGGRGFDKTRTRRFDWKVVPKPQKST